MTFKFEHLSEFIEVFDDQNTGPNLDTACLKSSMVPNDGLGKYAIQMSGQQPVRIWYHTDKSQNIPTKQSMLNFHYKWTTGM